MNLNNIHGNGRAKWQSIRGNDQKARLETILMYTASVLFFALIIVWVLNLKSTLGIPLAILLFTLLGLLIWRLLVIRQRDI